MNLILIMESTGIKIASLIGLGKELGPRKTMVTILSDKIKNMQ
jgi:cysteine synthase